MSEQETDHFRLIDATGDLVGSIAGASIASLHQGVDGILTGAVVMPGVAHTFRYLAGLFLNRGMAKREQQRLGLAYGLAAKEIERRLDRGEQLRTDGFFDPDKTDRSSADEIAEAVLLAAQKEHEERKLPYIAKLLAFTALCSRVLTESLAGRYPRFALSFERLTGRSISGLINRYPGKARTR